MRNSNFKFSLTLIAASLAACGTASADEAGELDEWTKPSSSVSVGIGAWDNDRPQFGIYDGMRDNAAYLLLDADIQKREDATGTWKNLSVKNLGLDNRTIRGEYLRQGDIGATFEYEQTTSKAPYTINTNHLGIGTNSQTTGADILNTAIGSGTNYQFGTERERLGFGFYKNLGPGLALRVKLSNEDKSGERITSNGNALFVADLIDWTTQTVETMLDYSEERLQLSGGYQGSLFKNNNDLGYVLLAPSTFMTQPLDNQAHKALLHGGYDFSETTRGNFKLEYNSSTQNELLQTSQVTTVNNLGVVPKIDGKVNTTLLQLGLASRPMPKLSLVASLRYYDVDDKTPQVTTVAQTDGTGTVDVNSTPYSYRTTSGKVEGTYDLTQGYSATAGIDYSEQDRTVHTTMGAAVYNPYVPLRGQLDETTYRLQLRKSMSETLTGSLEYSQGDRDGSDFAASSRTGTAFASPVHTADRKRQKARFALDWTPTEPLGIQLGIESATDEYGSGARSHGLHEGNVNLYSLDASYQLSEDWQLSGWYSYNTNDAHFINFNTVTNTFIKEQSDTGEAIGINLNGQVNEKTRVGAEFSLSNDKTAFAQANSDGTAIAVVTPEISSESAKIKLFANYDFTKRAEFRFDLAYEQWITNDWQWLFQDGKPWQFGAGSDGTTIITTPRQHSTFMGMRYIYKFQ